MFRNIQTLPRQLERSVQILYGVTDHAGELQHQLYEIPPRFRPQALQVASSNIILMENPLVYLKIHYLYDITKYD